MTEDNDELDFGWVDGTEAEQPAAPATTEQAPARRVRHAAAAPAPTGPRGRRPVSRKRIRARRAIALVTIVIVAFVAWFLIELFQPFTGSGSGSLTVVIKRGESTGQIGDELASRGVISSSFFFGVRAALDGDRSKFRAGLYQLRHGMSYAAALHALTQPPQAVEVSITIPEGFTRAQIGARVKADGLSGSYLAASTPKAAHFDVSDYGAPASTPSLEGFLFPATYFDYTHGSVAAFVAQQLQAFQQNFDGLDFAHAKTAHLTRYDVLIIASMIEREAEVPGDRALVSAVIYNRLRDGMPLGIDATLRYALNDYTQPLTESQLALDSPYNTRIHRGLPPTPISNPGLASMMAAADPAKVSYLYYVDKPNTCGKLAFATTYSQFEADVTAYDNARAADHGRAPTKCT